MTEREEAARSRRLGRFLLDVGSSTVERVSGRVHQFGRAVEIAGHVASFASWQSDRDLAPERRYVGREALWRGLYPLLDVGRVTVLEFGVSRGAATRIWLKHLRNPELVWHGFDTFTGLPEAWERAGVVFADAGAFDAGGTPPPISDQRVHWHVGPVEQTLPTVSLDPESRLVALFDFDLYAPTSYALERLGPCWKSGDVLYFDEAYDPWHERRAIDEFLDEHRVRCLGTTGIAIAFELREAREKAAQPEGRAAEARW